MSRNNGAPLAQAARQDRAEPQNPRRCVKRCALVLPARRPRVPTAKARPPGLPRSGFLRRQPASPPGIGSLSPRPTRSPPPTSPGSAACLAHNPTRSPPTTSNGEEGIRTLAWGLTPMTGLANQRFQPLSHLSRPCRERRPAPAVPFAQVYRPPSPPSTAPLAWPPATSQQIRSCRVKALHGVKPSEQVPPGCPDSLGAKGGSFGRSRLDRPSAGPCGRGRPDRSFPMGNTYRFDPTQTPSISNTPEPL